MYFQHIFNIYRDVKMSNNGARPKSQQRREQNRGALTIHKIVLII